MAINGKSVHHCHLTEECFEHSAADVVKGRDADGELLRLRGRGPGPRPASLAHGLQLLRDDLQPLDDEGEVLHADHPCWEQSEDTIAIETER